MGAEEVEEGYEGGSMDVWRLRADSAPSYTRSPGDRPSWLRQPAVHTPASPVHRDSGSFHMDDDPAQSQAEHDAALLAEYLELEAAAEANNMYEEDQLPPPVPEAEVESAAPHGDSLASEVEVLDSEFEEEIAELVERMQGQGLRHGEDDEK